MGVRSVRMTFRYDDDGLRLVDLTPRRSPPQPSDERVGEPPAAAIVLELRTLSGTVSFRRLLHDPIPQTLEARSAQRGLWRVPYVSPSGTFSVVVPAPESGAIVVVSAGPAVRLEQPGLRAGPGPARWRELLRTSAERP